MFRDVGSDEVQDHCGHIAIESGGTSSLVEGESILVACKAEPFLNKGSGGCHWVVGIALECQGSLLVHLGVEEAGQYGNFWVSSVGGERNGQGLLGVLSLEVWRESMPHQVMVTDELGSVYVRHRAEKVSSRRRVGICQLANGANCSPPVRYVKKSL